MMPRWLPLTLFAAFFAPGLLHAQQEPTVVIAPQVFIEIESQANRDKMYEDIEILRRILDRKLHAHYVRRQYSGMSNFNLPTPTWYASPQSAPYNNLVPYIFGNNANTGSIWWLAADGQLPQTYPTHPNQVWANLYQTPVAWEEVVSPTLEGVYLKGQGVVYTATLSTLQPAGKAEPAKPVSEWENVRRQLHNEKDEPKKAETRKPQTLSDVVLKVLAENGHHFAQLGENESLTIILTVHESSPAPKSAGQTKKTESKAPTSNSGSDVRGKLSDLELLGDLHQKQGHFEEAIKAFQKAVDHKGLEPKTAASLYRKLAQCYLAVEKMEDAKSALENASHIMKNAQEAAGNTGKPANAAKIAPVLPVKLIISVPKKLLEEAKEGQMPFEEFRRRASVETLRFENRR